MTGENIELPADEPPKGEWVDADEVIANPTEEEMAEGQVQGEAAFDADLDDPDDDTTGEESDSDAEGEDAPDVEVTEVNPEDE